MSMFISYARSDTLFVADLSQELKKRGIEFWMDTAHIPPGAAFPREIDQALRRAHHVLLVLSKEYFRSAWTRRELDAALNLSLSPNSTCRLLPIWHGINTTDLAQYSPILATVAAVSVDGTAAAVAEQLATCLNRGQTQEDVLVASQSSDNRFDLSPVRLPRSLSVAFIGRASELSVLDAAWQDKNVAGLSIIAAGGSGKTALVRRWLARHNFGRAINAQGCITWSFYRQGQHSSEVSEDEFLRAGLRAIGDTDPDAGSVEDRGRRLAEGLQSAPWLLVLDGLEPLQFPPISSWAGQLKGPGLKILLQHLATFNPGLVVVTSRLSVADVAYFDQFSELKLAPLTPTEGIHVFRELGVRGSDRSLGAATQEYGGHALSLTLLGNLLIARDLPVERRDLLIKPLRDELQLGEHARRIVQAYEEWFAATPELTVLKLVGIFDRPAEHWLLEAVQVAISNCDLATELKRIEPEQWAEAVQRLRRLSLLAPADSHDFYGSLDTHPIIREHFRLWLKGVDRVSYEAANEAVFRHLVDCTPHFPTALPDARNLYRAARHGCEARLSVEVFRDVYLERLLRPPDFFSIRTLGAVSEDLELLRGLFKRPFRVVDDTLNAQQAAQVLNQTGYCLRYLGRLREAIEASRASLKLSTELQEFTSASAAARSLEECLALRAEFDEALQYGELGASLAEKTGEPTTIALASTSHAAILAIAGRATEALVWLERGSRGEGGSRYSLHAQAYHYAYLYQLQGRYRDCVDVTTEARRALTTGHEPQLDAMLALQQGIGLLELSRADADQSMRQKAAEILRYARRRLSELSKTTIFPRCLAYLAEVEAELGNLEDAKKLIIEAQVTAESGGMLIYGADIDVARCRCAIAQGRPEEARANLARADAQVARTGYVLRKRSVAELRRQLEEDVTHDIG